MSKATTVRDLLRQDTTCMPHVFFEGEEVRFPNWCVEDVETCLYQRGWRSVGIIREVCGLLMEREAAGMLARVVVRAFGPFDPVLTPYYGEKVEE